MIKSIKSQGFHKEHDDLPIMGIGWGHIGYATGVSPTMDISWEYIGMYTHIYIYVYIEYNSADSASELL